MSSNFPLFLTLLQIHKEKRKLKCINTSKFNLTSFDIKQVLWIFLLLKDQPYRLLQNRFFHLPPRTSHNGDGDKGKLFPQPLTGLVTYFLVTVSHSWGLTNYLGPGTTLNRLPHDIILLPVSGGLPENYLSRAPLPSLPRSGHVWFLPPLLA